MKNKNLNFDDVSSHELQNIAIVLISELSASQRRETKEFIRQLNLPETNNTTYQQ